MLDAQINHLKDFPLEENTAKQHSLVWIKQNMSSAQWHKCFKKPGNI